MLVGDAGIIHRRLNISRLVDGARGDGVSARLRVLPIPMPKLPADVPESKRAQPIDFKSFF